MIKKMFTMMLTITILFSIALVSNAADKSLSDQIFTKLAPYGLTQGDRVKMERYIVDNNITNAQATEVLAKVDKAVAIMKESGVTDVKKLSSEKIKEVKALAQEAANIVGLTLNFKTSSVEIYKDGKLVEAIDHSNTKLAYTGNTLNTVLVSSSITAIALAVIFVAKNRFNKVGA